MCGSYTSQKLYSKASEFFSAINDIDSNGLLGTFKLNTTEVLDTVNNLTTEVAEILDQFAYNAPLDEAAAQIIHDAIQQIAGTVTTVVRKEQARVAALTAQQAGEVAAYDDEYDDYAEYDYQETSFTEEDADLDRVPF